MEFRTPKPGYLAHIWATRDFPKPKQRVPEPQISAKSASPALSRIHTPMRALSSTLSRLGFSPRKSRPSSTISQTTQSTGIQGAPPQHWDDDLKQYREPPTMQDECPDESQFAEASKVTVSPSLLAVTIFHAMAPSTPEMRTTAWLGANVDWNRQVLHSLGRLFNWEGESLEVALRQFCLRVRLQGETQQIGRCLGAVAERWVTCNPRHAFRSTDIIHRLAYSLVLLNQDLHGAREAGHVRISVRQYVESVMDSLPEAATNPEQFASEGELPDPVSETTFIDDSRPYTRQEWQHQMRGLLKLFYTSVRAHELESAPVDPSERGFERRQSSRRPQSALMASTASLNSTKRHSFSLRSRYSFASTHSRSSVVSTSPTPIPPEDNFGDEDEDPTAAALGLHKMRLQGPPWSKEGPLEYQGGPRSQRRARTTRGLWGTGFRSNWTECFALVDRGQLRLYHVASSKRPSTGDGDWMSRAKLLHAFRLMHSIAQHSANSPEWSLTLSDGRAMHFRTGSAAVADEYVYTCNYWAARLSKPPPTEMISTTEFGWDRPVELWRIAHESPDQHLLVAHAGSDAMIIGNERIVVHTWHPRQNSLLHSSLETDQQLLSLQEYVHDMDQELVAHNAQLGTLLALFPSGWTVTQRVMDNWERRSQFLLHQSGQYTQYCKVLERALQDQVKAKPVRRASLRSEHRPSLTGNENGSARSVKGSPQSVKSRSSSLNTTPDAASKARARTRNNLNGSMSPNNSVDLNGSANVNGTSKGASDSTNPESFPTFESSHHNSNPNSRTNNNKAGGSDAAYPAQSNQASLVPETSHTSRSNHASKSNHTKSSHSTQTFYTNSSGADSRTNQPMSLVSDSTRTTGPITYNVHANNSAPNSPIQGVTIRAIP